MSDATIEYYLVSSDHDDHPYSMRRGLPEDSMRVYQTDKVKSYELRTVDERFICCMSISTSGTDGFVAQITNSRFRLARDLDELKVSVIGVAMSDGIIRKPTTAEEKGYLFGKEENETDGKDKAKLTDMEKEIAILDKRILELNVNMLKQKITLLCDRINVLEQKASSEVGDDRTSSRMTAIEDTFYAKIEKLEERKDVLHSRVLERRLMAQMEKESAKKEAAKEEAAKKQYNRDVFNKVQCQYVRKYVFSDGSHVLAHVPIVYTRGHGLTLEEFKKIGRSEGCRILEYIYHNTVDFDKCNLIDVFRLFVAADKLSKSCRSVGALSQLIVRCHRWLQSHDATHLSSVPPSVLPLIGITKDELTDFFDMYDCIDSKQYMKCTYYNDLTEIIDTSSLKLTVDDLISVLDEYAFE